jgi:hypothetical protein
LKVFLDRERVRQEWIETLPPQKNHQRHLFDGTSRIVPEFLQSSAGAAVAHWNGL